MTTIEPKLCTAITKSTKKACKYRAQIGSMFCKSHKLGNFKTQEPTVTESEVPVVEPSKTVPSTTETQAIDAAKTDPPIEVGWFGWVKFPWN